MDKKKKKKPIMNTKSKMPFFCTISSTGLLCPGKEYSVIHAPCLAVGSSRAEGGTA